MITVHVGTTHDPFIALYWVLCVPTTSQLVRSPHSFFGWLCGCVVVRSSFIAWFVPWFVVVVVRVVVAVVVVVLVSRLVRCCCRYRCRCRCTIAGLVWDYFIIVGRRVCPN